MSFALALAALAIGLTLGLLGGGGAILTVPALVVIGGIAPKSAMAASLLVVAFAGGLGAWRHFRSGTVRLKPALSFAVASILGALAGGRLAALLSEDFRLTLFAFFVLAGAVSMWRGIRAIRQSTGVSRFLMPVLGGLVGVITGVIGVGGGFMIVPALVAFAGLPMRNAVGTSLVILSLNSTAGFLVQVGRVDMPWAVLGGFIGVAAIGTIIGERVNSKIEASVLRRVFAGLLVAVGTWVLWRQYGV
jgi:uncharacterized membrane protein YfcA